MDDGDVRNLVRRIRAGEAEAAEALVRACEPELRRVIRVRLTDVRLRRFVDSLDICQSVLAGFFVRTAAGQYDIQSPEELLKLLATMARNRVIDWARRSNAERRDGRREVPLYREDGQPRPIEETQSGPVSIVVNRELLEQVRSRLAADELRLMEQRADGQNWNDIAAQSGEHPNAVRMRLTRALDRVAEELGLEQSHV
jgi:RNA polymerase sigma factor (sigma-70 family)